jgi:hypothetical protein
MLGGPRISSFLMGPKTEHTKTDLEQKESSAVWASSKDSCTEAPGGAAGQSPLKQKADETSLIGGAPANY